MQRPKGNDVRRASFDGPPDLAPYFRNGRLETIPAKGERRLAEQAEASYKQMVRDWQAAAPKKVGASVTPGRASQKPSKGKVARQTTSP